MDSKSNVIIALMGATSLTAVVLVLSPSEEEELKRIAKARGGVAHVLVQESYSTPYTDMDTCLLDTNAHADGRITEELCVKRPDGWFHYGVGEGGRKTCNPGACIGYVPTKCREADCLQVYKDMNEDEKLKYLQKVTSE